MHMYLIKVGINWGWHEQGPAHAVVGIDSESREMVADDHRCASDNLATRDYPTTGGYALGLDEEFRV